MTVPWTARPANWGAPGHANRGDENEAIADQIEFLSSGFPIIMKYKTADVSRASTAAYADDNELAASVVASAAYSVEVYGNYQAGATGQIKFQMTFPTGATLEGGSWEYDAGTDAAGAVNWASNGTLSSSSPAAFVAGLVGTGGNVPFRLTGLLITSTTPGILALQWAQNVSNATATILRKGSWMRLCRCA